MHSFLLLVINNVSLNLILIYNPSYLIVSWLFFVHITEQHSHISFVKSSTIHLWLGISVHVRSFIYLVLFRLNLRLPPSTQPIESIMTIS